MKKVIFILAMLFAPSLFAATLTTNTVPYVCQGGTSPQLCNSNMTTDSNGNLSLFGPWTSMSSNTVYQAATDLLVIGYSNCTSNCSNAYVNCLSDSSPNPSTRRQFFSSTSSAWQAGCTMPVRKNDYWKYNTSGTTDTVNIVSL